MLFAKLFETLNRWCSVTIRNIRQYGAIHPWQCEQCCSYGFLEVLKQKVQVFRYSWVLFRIPSGSLLAALFSSLTRVMNWEARLHFPKKEKLDVNVLLSPVWVATFAPVHRCVEVFLKKLTLCACVFDAPPAQLQHNWENTTFLFFL